MAGQIATKTFNGGMNKDLDFSILPENKYSHAENFKLIADEDANGFILENAEGNSSYLDIDELLSGDDFNIAGYAYIRNRLIIFATENTSDTPSSSNNSAIIKCELNDRDEITYDSVIYNDALTSGKLNLSTYYPIKAKAYYESDDIIKVYWADGYNEVRFMNIEEDISDFPVYKFSFVPSFEENIGDYRVEFDELTSGRLKASAVQYTYQLYNKNGSSTKYVPLSPSIPIPKGDPSGSFKDYEGGQKDEEVYKGCKIKINTPASGLGYDRIRLVALDYNTINDIPNIRVFGEYEIDPEDGSTMYFMDRGDTIEELTYEEFLVKGNVLYSAEDIEIKDKRLFLANIEEDRFDLDFDARTYRFKDDGGGSPTSRLYQSDLSSYYTLSGVDGGWTYSATGETGTNWEIPEKADCINIYNDPNEESTAANEYVYQTDLSTIGAEGKNVKIQFVDNDSLVIDNRGYNTGCGIYNPDSGESTAYPYNVAYYRNFQRMEVYRLGLIFYDEKFRPSLVKWMCDLKMPGYDNTFFGDFVNYSDPDTEANLLGLRVTLKNEPTEDYMGWQVVMVPRESDDRSVLANGIIQVGYDEDTNGATSQDFTRPLNDPSVGSTTIDTFNDGGVGFHYNDELPMFISPEVNFNNNINFKDGDWLQIIGSFNYDTATQINNRAGTDENTYYVKLSDFSSSYDYSDTNKFTLIDGQVVPLLDDEENTIMIGNHEYNNNSFNSARDDHEGLHGTLFVGCTESGEGLTNGSYYGTESEEVLVGSYRRRVFESQYGGLSYYARTRNEYIPCSRIKYGEATIDTYEGDTYIDYFWYLENAWDIDESSGTTVSFLLFPIESTLPISLRYDEIYPRNTNNDAVALIQEVAGRRTNSTLGVWDQQYDLYQLNTVYTTLNKGFFHNVMLFDQSDRTDFKTRIRSSDLKTNGEIEDSFTTFKINDFIDLDGVKGEVNNILTFKNNLFFWQDSGFGIVSVNTRSLIQDNQPGILALGTGGILERYDYISDSIGNVNPYGVISSRKSLYWADNNKNELFKYDGNEKSLGKIKGIQSWVNENGYIENAILVYDEKYNDVVYTLTFDDDDVYSLTFSEIADNFISFNSFEPTRYIKMSNKYLSTEDDHSLWEHNSDTANRGQYYGTYYDSVIDIPFTKDYAYTKTFDALKWVSESFDGNVNQFKDTFDTVSIYNNYQHTGERNLYYQQDSAPASSPTPISRRERTWSMSIPRNIVDEDVSDNPDIFNVANHDETQLFKERIRDKYMVAEFTYSNDSSDYTFSVPFVSCLYRKSYR